jgi:hypothetical protein
MTADAENHSAIAATWQTAMIETEAAFDPLCISTAPGGADRVRSSAA